MSDCDWKAQAAFEEYSHDRSIEEIQKKLTDANQHITELEGRLRALWDKLEGERKHYDERIRRLEEAGDRMVNEGWNEPHLAAEWRKAKEAKP